MKHIKILFAFFLMLVFVSCTKLEEKFKTDLEQTNSGSLTADQFLTTAYESLNGPFQWGDVWHSQEHTSDEIIAPTRGPDWDDNGQWRALHAHTWNADQGQIVGAFNGLLSAQFAASNVLQYNPSAQQAAEARFLRALTIYWVLDGYDQVPFREDLNDFKILPITLKGAEAAQFIIDEIGAVMGDLPDNAPAYRASKNAARALLMKVFLNRGVYLNRTTPTFDPGDMAQVISLADQIIATNKYQLNDNYFDIFAPANETTSKEGIFTLWNKPGTTGGNVRGNVFAVHHYNQNPGGWNGFSTLSVFYDKFEAADQRRGLKYNYTGALPNPGNRQNVGFFVGQQYDMTTDAALKDRGSAPLIFTREVKLIETGSNLEVTGIRVIKYPFDYATAGDQKDNDWVLFRLADVLLMKAEALLRTNNAAGGLTIVNSIRAKRGVPDLATLDLTSMLDERGRELYWEGFRRQDLIRFGKFLEAWQEKAADAGTANLLFPIPSNQLAVNANLTQNPGYQ